MRAERVAAITGLTGVALFAVANALWAFEQPPPDATGPALVAFYEDLSARIVAGGLLSLTSLGVLALFAVALRRVLLERDADALLADTALAGVLLALAPGLGAETINAGAAMRAGDGTLTEPLALALFDVSYALGSYAVGPGFGLAVLAVSAAALRDRALLPRPLAYAGLVLAVALVTPLAASVLGEYTAAPPLLLVAVVAARLLRSGERS